MIISDKILLFSYLSIKSLFTFTLSEKLKMQIYF